jgi:UDP-glucuronate decarboxylase
MTSNVIIKEDLNTIFQADIDWTKFKDSTVLITGAGGFLPAYLVEALLYLNFINPKNNVKIIGLVRNLTTAKARFKEYLQNPNLEFVEQDVSEPIEIGVHLDYIIHAASQASPKYYGIDPVGTLKANVMGTLNLLELARKNDVKSFLYFSSSEIYGEVSADEIPIKEYSYGFLDPVQVRSCYAESKRMGENICVSYFYQYRIPAKIVRPFHTYGPKMRLDDGRVYADFVANVVEGHDIAMTSDGSAVRAFCYLTDATIAFLKVLLEGSAGEAYNVGNPKEEYSILQLAEIITNVHPEKGLKVIRQKAREDNTYLKSPLKRNSPDISKIHTLNWFPSVSAAEGFQRTIESYNEV